MTQPTGLHLVPPPRNALVAERRLPPRPGTTLNLRSARLTPPTRTHTPQIPAAVTTPLTLPSPALPSQVPPVVLHSP